MLCETRSVRSYSNKRIGVYDLELVIIYNVSASRSSSSRAHSAASEGIVDLRQADAVKITVRMWPRNQHHVNARVNRVSPPPS
jgi:hypothetical protein